MPTEVPADSFVMDLESNVFRRKARFVDDGHFVEATVPATIAQLREMESRLRGLGRQKNGSGD